MIAFIKQTVLPHFGIEPRQAQVSSLGRGHINATFLIRWPAGQFVLQRMNSLAFPNPEAVVNNAEKISQHLIAKTRANRYRLQQPSPYRTVNNQLAVDLNQQGFWRAMHYITPSHSLEVVNSAKEAEVAARAFGHFSYALNDLCPHSLIEVIPEFHHLPTRLAQLQRAVGADSAQRLASCQQWIDFIFAQNALLTELSATMPQLPVRICHNDTKINNMLFNQADISSAAIIDLDTCMPGQLMHDFGDMVRTFCSPVAEDATDLSKITIRTDIFAAICHGYLDELKSIITPIEQRSLWLGAQVMCFMVGVRFLTDYLNGDQYFNVRHARQNLDRAINQLTLYQRLLAQKESLIKHCTLI